MFLWFWTMFCPFTPLTTPKIKIFKKFEKTLGYYQITNVYHKWQWYDVWFLRYEAQHNFSNFGQFFALLPSSNPKNQNFEKMKKTTPGDIINLHYQFKWKSYDVWFLRYGTSQTGFFCHFGPPLLITQKTKILKKWKKGLEILPV